MVYILFTLLALVAGWLIWRRYARWLLHRKPAEAYILQQDAAWSAGQDRSLGLSSAINLRDIGGYPAADGKRIKWGMLYRSGTLAALSADDAATLAARGINVICDFRSEAEATAYPDNAERFGARYEPLPLNADLSSLQRLRMMMFQPQKLNALMQETYTDLILDQNAPLLGRFLRLVAEPDNLPLLFHCTAGKDRTGMGALILMSLLGVPDDVIAADYSLSNIFYATFRTYVGEAMAKVRWMGLTVDDARPLLIADPEMLRVALASVREKHGSVEAYVIDRCGVDAATISRLRALLLEDVTWN